MPYFSQFSMASSITSLFLGGERKPENSEETRTNTGRTRETVQRLGLKSSPNIYEANIDDTEILVIMFIFNNLLFILKIACNISLIA